MKLHDLKASTITQKKRLGRGYGSGKGGHTSSRGSKGQRARVGRGVPLWFEGGQLPFVRRLPYLRGKLRFQNLKGEAQTITLSILEKLGAAEITPEVLAEKHIIRSTVLPLKVTNVGTLTRAIAIKGIRVTAAARKAIEKAGGSVA
jgi:large subunit ribosomal protein L15